MSRRKENSSPALGRTSASANAAFNAWCTRNDEALMSAVRFLAYRRSGSESCSSSRRRPSRAGVMFESFSGIQARRMELPSSLLGWESGRFFAVSTGKSKSAGRFDWISFSRRWG